MKAHYLCVTIDRDGKMWRADVSIRGKRIKEKSPTAVIQHLADLGYEIVTASYSHSMVPFEGSVARHVVWMRSTSTPSEDVRALN